MANIFTLLDAANQNAKIQEKQESYHRNIYSKILSLELNYSFAGVLVSSRISKLDGMDYPLGLRVTRKTKSQESSVLKKVDSAERSKNSYLVGIVSVFTYLYVTW